MKYHAIKKILMLITGGIAAHKTPSIVSALSIHCGHEVHLMTTRNALKFVTEDALMYGAKKWWNGKYMAHIDATNGIDKLVVIPATANIIGKIANGIADDEVSTTCLRCPSHITKILFPAMNSDMWENRIVQDNIEKLLYYGWCVVDPGYGKMACGSYGKGVLPDTKDVANCITEIYHEREILINSEIDCSEFAKWYSKYTDKRFRIYYGETEEHYHVDTDYFCNDLNFKSFSPSVGGSYPVRKEDGKIIYLTHLNRIDYRNINKHKHYNSENK